MVEMKMLANPIDVAFAVSAGEVRYDVLRRRPDVLTARATVEDDHSVIVKLWNRPTLRGALRRLTRTNTGYREWRALNILRAARVRVPRPLAYVRLTDPRCTHTEALVSEDLGRAGRTIDRVKTCIAAGDHDALAAIENELISLTADVLRAGIVDPDHRLENFIFARDGRLARIDLEHGVSICTPWGALRYGTMLGTLIGSYVFAVQPHIYLADAFARRLAERMAPPPRVLRRAAAVSKQMLDHQRETIGIDARLSLGWT